MWLIETSSDNGKGIKEPKVYGPKLDGLRTSH